MSARPTVRSPALDRLIDEGYEVEVRMQHLLVHAVPYVTARRLVRRGTLVCTYIESAGQLDPPDNHQVWFTGEYPCFADGSPIAALENERGARELFTGCTVQHRFSNKPDGISNFRDHHEKMVHYVRVLSDQARVLEPQADARTGQIIEAVSEESVFRYLDTASARAEILGLASCLVKKIAIIGLGGTGSYILDQVAKTHACEIHIFDGDEFRQHNAFRAPGAATLDELRRRMPKVEYFKAKYEAMRRAIEAHTYFIDETNITELAGIDFVFVCVDRGPARQEICAYLRAQGIPFIDVGVSVELVPETRRLIGMCRTTLVTSEKSDHVDRYVPMVDNDDGALYRRNIQIADLNALNAMFAVIKWKQYFGFYQDDFGSHHDTYSVSSQSLTRDAMTKVAAR